MSGPAVGRYQASLLAVPANFSSCCEKAAGRDQLHRQEI